jgi:Tol biopolymer transport system component
MPFDPANAGAEAKAVNVTNHPRGDFSPAWSPDGTMIAFTSNRESYDGWHPIRLIDDGGFRTTVHTMKPDGSALRKVVSSMTRACGDPAWSADGRRLAYCEVDAGLNARVCEVEADGSGRRVISPRGVKAIMPGPGPNDGWLFVELKGEGGLARLRGTTSLHWQSRDGSVREAKSPSQRNLLAPDCHVGSSRIVCHGDGTTRLPLMSNGRPFTWPVSDRYVRLPDRIVRLKPYRGYFPSFNNAGERIYDIPWIHEVDGRPPGVAPIIAAAFDGSELTEVHSVVDDGFMWAPVVTRDGAWIFYSKGPRMAPPEADVDIWKVKADGTGPVNLTPDSSANDALADVSADGRRVVFRSGRHGDHEVFVMDDTGANLRRLSFASGPDTMPAISADGRLVTYVTARTGRGLHLWIQSLDDPKDEGRLLEPARARLKGLEMHPRFSPDGKWVVFTSIRAGMYDEWLQCGFAPQPYGELFAAPVDGRGPAVQLTNDKWEDGLAFWGMTSL